MKDYILVYLYDERLPFGYVDSDFQSNRDSRKSTSGFLFTLGGKVVSWRSVKQSCITESIINAKYVVASKALKEVIWLQKFLIGLGIVPLLVLPLVLFCDNSGAVA